MKFWSSETIRDHGSHRVFGCPAYVDVKKDMLDSKVNKLVFLGYMEDLKCYNLWDLKNKKFVSSRQVMLDEASMVKSTISQQVEKMKIKLLSQRVESHAIPRYPIGFVSFGISPIMTLGGDYATLFDTEHVREVVLVAARRTKLNPRKWVVKKYGSQVGELDQKLKLKTAILHVDYVGEIHMP